MLISYIIFCQLSSCQKPGLGDLLLEEKDFHIPLDLEPEIYEGPQEQFLCDPIFLVTLPRVVNMYKVIIIVFFSMKCLVIMLLMLLK